MKKTDEELPIYPDAISDKIGRNSFGEASSPKFETMKSDKKVQERGVA